MTRDENRGAEAARMAALHNLTGPAEERCWTDIAAENERLRKAFAKLAVALDASVADELAQRALLRELTAENERLQSEVARLGAIAIADAAVTAKEQER